MNVNAKVKLLSVAPYSDSLLMATFSNGRISFFAHDDLSWEFWRQLEKMENELEEIGFYAAQSP